MARLLLLLVLVTFQISVLAQKQGIKGQVFWIGGNQMPGPKKSNSPQQGIIREIIIYNSVKLQDTKQTDGFFTEIPGPPVASILSKADGSFRINLPPGNYSVFVKESKGLFANLFDGEGNINPITVKERKYSWLTLSVDYEAVY
ncbi:MAG TPA: carboxypeptidase regulatory-like domain-containing protein [Chryseolinea sp.]|nr:carboxypeptidase regulatory-like domain-containing protein [Chryseolinea sp.]HPM32537.1 carboxypeptidase regulatory-like domain-containing protein [Chryseolinea sp.]